METYEVSYSKLPYIYFTSNSVATKCKTAYYWYVS